MLHRMLHQQNYNALNSIARFPLMILSHILYSLWVFLIQCKAVVESDHNVSASIFTISPVASFTLLSNRAATKQDNSSKRGTDCFVIGATRFFDAIRLQYTSVSCSQRKYTLHMMHPMYHQMHVIRPTLFLCGIALYSNTCPGKTHPHPWENCHFWFMIKASSNSIPSRTIVARAAWTSIQ